MLTEGACHAAQLLRPAPSTILRMVPLPVPGRSLLDAFEMAGLEILSQQRGDAVSDDLR